MANGMTAGGEEGSSILLETARPDLFQVNAFRVTGLPVDATAFDINKQAEQIRMFEKWGRGRPPGGAFELQPPATADQVRASLQRLRDPEQRLVDEFFWFWPHALGEGKTDEALVALARGDAQSAANVWNRQESYQSVANVSTHNLAVLSHVQALDLELLSLTRRLTDEEAERRNGHWRSAFERWGRLLNDEGFWSRLTARIRDLEDPRLTAGTARRIRSTLPLALLHINAQLAAQAAEDRRAEDADRHVKLVRDAAFDTSVIEESLRLAVASIRQRLKNYCRTAEQEADRSPETADRAARRLLDQSRPLLDALNLLLPPGNATRDGAHDEVALRALVCQIVFGNKTEDWVSSLQLLEEILPLAASDSARARIQENLNIVKRNREAGLCYFCEEDSSEDACGIEVKMYGDVVRTPTWNGTHITWRKLTLKVPRCGLCKSIHDKAGSWTGVGVVAGLLAGLAYCVPVADEGHMGWAFLVFLVLEVGLTTAFSVYAQKKIARGVKNTGSTNGYSGVQQMLKQGWSFGEGPSTT